MRVFQPLKEGHPLIGEECPLCHSGFFAGQRTLLAPAREPLTGYENVPAIPVHASCALKGMKITPITQEPYRYSVEGPGIIARIADGDASPFPVVLEDGRQFKLEEVGLKGG